jgi:hypothetical protein
MLLLISPKQKPLGEGFIHILGRVVETDKNSPKDVGLEVLIH